MSSVAFVPKAFSGLDSFYEFVHVFGSGAAGLRFHCERGARRIDASGWTERRVERDWLVEADAPPPAVASAPALSYSCPLRSLYAHPIDFIPCLSFPSLLQIIYQL